MVVGREFLQLQHAGAEARSKRIFCGHYQMGLEMFDITNADCFVQETWVTFMIRIMKEGADEV